MRLFSVNNKDWRKNERWGGRHMKSQFIFLSLILILLITSCGPSAEEISTQTVTAATAIAASWTKTPTLTPTLTKTPTFTPTLTPTPTMTPTITPTPLGGGSGQIVCLNCNGIFPSISIVKLDGTETTILSDQYSYNNSSKFLAWSKDGSMLTYFGEGGICVINVNNFDDNCLDILVGPQGVAWSPDGTLLAVAGEAMTIVNVESSENRISTEKDYIGGMDWSPDGTKLAFSTNSGITVINVKSGEIQPLVEGSESNFFNNPRWSPNGNKIVYTKRSNLFIANADGSDETLLVQNASYPLWSPDSTKIVYITGFNDQEKIIMMNIDGSNKIRLTPSNNLYYMTWSSDGKYIVYLTFNGSRGNPIFDLYSVDVARQEVFSLAKSTGTSGYTLSPDGSMIAFSTYVKSEDPNKFIVQQYLARLDGTIISELNIPGEIGSWRP